MPVEVPEVVMMVMMSPAPAPMMSAAVGVCGG
jgi:hypothetical protein